VALERGVGLETVLVQKPSCGTYVASDDFGNHIELPLPDGITNSSSWACAMREAENQCHFAQEDWRHRRQETEKEYGREQTELDTEHTKNFTALRQKVNEMIAKIQKTKEQNLETLHSNFEARQQEIEKTKTVNLLVLSARKKWYENLLIRLSEHRYALSETSPVGPDNVLHPLTPLIKRKSGLVCFCGEEWKHGEPFQKVKCEFLRLNAMFDEPKGTDIELECAFPPNEKLPDQLVHDTASRFIQLDKASRLTIGFMFVLNGAEKWPHELVSTTLAKRLIGLLNVGLMFPTQFHCLRNCSWANFLLGVDALKQYSVFFARPDNVPQLPIFDNGCGTIDAETFDRVKALLARLRE
jgi:hypothetical protein